MALQKFDYLLLLQKRKNLKNLQISSKQVCSQWIFLATDWWKNLISCSLHNTVSSTVFLHLKIFVST